MHGAPPQPAIRTTCPYCGVGCGVLATPDGEGGTLIKGDPDHPANFGRLCSKGSALGETLGLDGRLLHPEIGGRRANWDEALAHVAAEFGRTADLHGPGAIAFYLSGQLLTEDYYVANKLAKGFIGTPHVDTNSRLCMASSVAGHKRAFGADVVPQCYEDLDEADLVVLAGSNAAWCHPVLFQRIQRARSERGTRVVTIDPRRTATSEGADLHLAIAPGTDALLWNGLLVWLAEHGHLDEGFIHDHCEGFEKALAQARRLAPDAQAIAADSGLSAHDIETFWRLWAATPRVVSCYSQGVNQSTQGTDKVNAILNCHLATGRIGKPGSGPFSLTGQPNAMGGREVGGMANVLAAHMGFSPEERDRVRRFWNAPNLVAGEGHKAVAMFEAIARGEIKALWVIGTNPAVSLPDADGVRAALSRLELFVVSENVASNDTADLAHVRLPAAAWGEKDGTVTNSERRISRQRAFLPLPGEARPDWWIVKEVARQCGWAAAFAYDSPADIFREHAALSGFENDGARAFDISAAAQLMNAQFETLQPFQWPYSVAGKPTKRLFANGRFFTPTGKARFIPVKAPALANPPSTARPFILNTGRIRDQWHTMTRTGKSPRLAAHVPEPFIELHPADAEALHLVDGDLAQVETARGKAVLRVRIAPGQNRGSAFAPIHWSAANSSLCRVGALVDAVTDPISGQPEAKATPACIRPLPVKYNGFILSRARPLVADMPYWSAAPVQAGHLTMFAGDEPGIGWRRWAEKTCGSSELLSMEDPTLGRFRFVRIDGDRLDAALFIGLMPEMPGTGWLRAVFASGTAPAGGRRALLAGHPPSSTGNDGPPVCVCFEVSAARIIAGIAGGARSVEEIGRILRAGTNCGSCVPEIRALVKSSSNATSS